MIEFSVVVPTRNRAKTLALTLESIAKQTLPLNKFEVIVVDNGSTDDTADVCARLAGAFLHFTRLYDSRPGLHVGRNLGLERAKAELIVYADDDIDATPEWLEGIRAGFADPETVLVGGRNLPWFEVAPTAWIRELWIQNSAGERICGPLSLIDLGDAPRPINPKLVYGCNFAIRKSALTAAGGFHPDGMPQELIRYRGDGETHVSCFIERTRMQASYQPRAAVRHLVSSERMTTQYFWRRAFNQGISDSYTDVRTLGDRTNISKLHDHVRRARCVLGILRLLTRGQIRKALEVAAWGRGYTFHQDNVRRDLSVRAWCCQPNDLGANATVPPLRPEHLLKWPA